MKKIVNILLFLHLLATAFTCTMLIQTASAQQLRQGDIAGGPGGRAFSDVDNLNRMPGYSTVAEVRIRSGVYIDSIQIVHRAGNNQLYPLPRHGGSGGRPDTFHLNPGEYIKKIHIRYGRFVDSIEIITNLENRRRYGGRGGHMEKILVAGENEQIVGFHGRSGSLLDALGIIVRTKY